MKSRLFILLVLLVTIMSCRKEDVLVPSEQEQKGDAISSGYKGFYLLNEGNMGSNKATLDFYDFETATYTRNIFTQANPSMVHSLGDVGNDLKVYGGRLYAVINCSNLVEVMDVATAKHIGTIECPNCRYLTFKDGYGYLTSYAGPVVVGTEHAQIGYVAKFDTATLQVVNTCHVGYQPDELEVVGNKLYVANSGGYMVPNYETTLSVIDLDSFDEIGRIEVAPNLYRVRKDRYGQLWVSSRGDYQYDAASRTGHQPKLYCIDPAKGEVIDSMEINVSNCCLDGDSIYIVGSSFNYNTMESEVTYGIVNVETHEVVTKAFINDPSVDIQTPYGILVQPDTKDIYVADAKTYVTPGTLWCIGQDGKGKWSVRTGDIPAHMAVVY